jgi:hypothetical protein
MVLAFLIGAGLELMAALENPTEWWLFLVIPVVLGMLTLMHAIARASDSQSTSPASVINRFHAGLVYAYSFVAAVAAPIFHTWQLGAPIMSIYALVLSVALGAMSWFIWRGATWAMIVVWALVTMQWLVLASLDPSFWVKIAYVAPPIMFALLTIVSIVAAKMRAT